MARTNNAEEVAPDQRHCSAFHRHIGAGAHRESHIGCGESRRVVDAVTGHRNDAALLAQLADAIVFVLRLDASFDFIDAEFPGDGAGGASSASESSTGGRRGKQQCCRRTTFRCRKLEVTV